MAQDYDQRFVRREDDGFKALGGSSLCQSCGRRSTCPTIGTIMRNQVCTVFLPVITFPDHQGLDKPCNTFRRGLGLFRRLDAGQMVALFSKKDNKIIGHGIVGAKHAGVLSGMLAEHAGANHLMLEEFPHEAPFKLFRMLQRMYGKNHSDPGATFSVVYLEPACDRD